MIPYGSDGDSGAEGSTEAVIEGIAVLYCARVDQPSELPHTLIPMHERYRHERPEHRLAESSGLSVLPVWVQPGQGPSTIATSEEWVTAFVSAIRNANPEVQAAWDSWDNSGRRLMAVISERTTPGPRHYKGGVAHERYGVSKTGSNQVTVERLQRNEHVVADETTRTGGA